MTDTSWSSEILVAMVAAYFVRFIATVCITFFVTLRT